MKELPIQTATWDDLWFFDLDINQKIVWMFFLSNPIVSIAGILRIAPAILAGYCSTDTKTIIAVLDSLQSQGKILLWDNFVYIINWRKYHSYNERTILAADKIIGSLPDNIKELIKGIEGGSLPLPNGLRTHHSNSNNNNINTLKREDKSAERRGEISVDWELVREKWNEIAEKFPNIPAINLVSSGRKAKYKTRLNSGLDFLEMFDKIISRIEESSALKGGIGWRFNFDYLFRSDETFSKVIEGGFTDTNTPDKLGF